MVFRQIKLLLLVSFIIAGCSRVNQQNYNELAVGLSYKTVTGLLGKPDECSEQMGTRSCVWGDKKRFIRASFVADKLVLYSGEGLK